MTRKRHIATPEAEKAAHAANIQERTPKIHAPAAAGTRQTGMATARASVMAPHYAAQGGGRSTWR